MVVEEVAQLEAEVGGLEASSATGEVVAEGEVCTAVAGQGALGVGGVVEVHAGDVACVPVGLEPAVVEVNKAVEDGGGGEGEGGVVVVVDGELLAVGPVPVLDIFVEVADVVLAEGCIGLEGEPGGGGEACCELDAQAVAAADVGGERLAYVADLACLYELVVVEHGIEVGSCIPAGVGEAVAQLDIVDTLRMWGRIGTVVSKVVALRLAMAEGIGSVGIVASVVVAEACLGVDEVVALEDIERLVGIGTIIEGIELIVDAAGGKAHIAVLDISKGLPGGCDVVGALQVDAHIVLVG